MRIAILGWGSLINEPRDLPIVGPWSSDGPVLLVEFSRISKSGNRAGCLTLVIDEEQGTEITTYYTLSRSTELTEAIRSLENREGTSRRYIGYYDVAQGQFSEGALTQHPRSCERIRQWAHEMGFDAVIWTALPPRFEEVTGTSYSPGAAINYLNSLSEDTGRNAVAYIANAPDQTKTRFRDLVAKSSTL